MLSVTPFVDESSRPHEALDPTRAEGSEPALAAGTDPTVAASAGSDATLAANRAVTVDLSNVDELARGTVVGRYVIVNTLGRGGMGVVYKAFDPELDRPVALKLVAFGPESDQARTRLAREAKTLAQLSHPNVVAVHDVGAHGSDIFVAMELVEGTTLRQWLQEAPRTPRDILAMFLAAGAGLAEAHRLGIVHRDFKPDNVMVDARGRVRVVDFGLARAEGRAPVRPSLLSLAIAAEPPDELTRAGAIMGTPAYMAPEQDLGNEVDGRSDQFSFCASLYEALYGQRPFAGTSYLEIAEHRLAGDVRSSPRVRGVSARVRRALLRGLRVESGARHASMDALLVELRGRQWRRRTKLALAATAVAGLAGGGWATWVATHPAPSAADLCNASAREVERVWNPERRRDVLSGFASTSAGSRVAADRVVTGFDRYATDWTSRRVALCKLALAGDATHERDQRVAARLTCLKSRLQSLDGAVSVFTHAANQTLVERGDTIVAELPSLAPCDAADTTTLVAEQTRDRMKPMLEAIVNGNLALANNNLVDAERLATGVVDAATAANEREPLAAGLLLLGQVQARTASAAARATLLRAVHAATDVREEGMVVQAWIEILSLAFADRRMLGQLDDELFAAEVAALRLDERNPLRSKLAYTTGTIRLLRGEIDPALARLGQAVAAFERDPAKYRYEIAAARSSIGVAHLYRGEWDRARAALEQSRDAWKTLPDVHPNLATSIGWLGEVAAFQHDFTSAEPQFAEAVALLEGIGPNARSQLAAAQFQLAYLWARTGRCDRARPALARVRALALDVQGKDSPLEAQALLGEAHCLLDAGNARRAVRVLERALAIATPAPSTQLQLPAIELTLARALFKTDRKARRRAIALAEQARAGFARFPGARAELALATAFLRRPGA